MPIELDAGEAKQLESVCRRARRSVLRMAHAGRCEGLSGALSLVDMLVVLYHKCLYVDPANPQLPDRDRLVLSKSHASAAALAVMAERGYFAPDSLLTETDPGKWLDAPDASPGQGLSVALGMALAARMGQHPCHVYAVAGDGELQNGEMWEAVMFAGARMLDNLTLLVDRNGLQGSGRVDDQLTLNPLPDKFRAFNWNVLIVDGHNVRALTHAISLAREYINVPTVVIANTVSGKGFGLAENREEWRRRRVTAEELAQAIQELSGE
ncbi:MAG TPA: 1-deoxy-D-xylulose-5-phosphate synthase N-terminal domain-containing protein [Candidatus Brocadiia bacterium]|nr:1-deoxy-D-xylulose-5-phosphate synthase N-terminal domain-containing protein [Candidatus Brocadiia bacterium]